VTNPRCIEVVIKDEPWESHKAVDWQNQRQIYDGRWKMEDGRWKLEDGRWKMEDG
jgi:hypothetical protein